MASLRPQPPGQRRPRHPSLLGDGLLERIRSTSLALLGLTTVVGLGLIAFTLQLGWSVAPDLPIPGVPNDERAAVSERAVVASPARPAPTVRLGDASGAIRPSGSAGAQSAPADSELAPAHRVVAPVPNPVSPAAEQPSEGGDAPSPSPEPPPTQAAPAAPAPVTPVSPPPAPSGSAPPVTATVNVPPKDDSKSTGRWRSSGRGSWKGKVDKDRWSNDPEYEAPLPATKDDVPESTVPSYDGYDDGSDDDDEWDDEGDSSGWGDRGHGHHR